MNTTPDGLKDEGSVNGTGFAPVVAMAPLKTTMPLTRATAGFQVPNGLAVQPFWSVNLVKVGELLR